MSLQEACSGFKPSLLYLRVFNSISFFHVSNERMTKLDEKREIYFIGYDSRPEGYIISTIQ